MNAVPETGAVRPAARRQRIAQHVLNNGTASAAALAQMLDVSLMTVHRDLNELERQGVLRKHYGGVTAQPSSVFESHLSVRRTVAPDAKAAIAREARHLVEPGMAVMLDDSTTALALAHELGSISPLTVVTNFIDVIELAKTWVDVQLIALGGVFNAAHNSFLGLPCIDALSSIRVDILFTSTSTITDGVAFHQEQEIVLVKQSMLATASRKVLLMDHTKLGRTALHRVASLTDFDILVTDDGAPPETIEAMREEQLEVSVASAHDPGRR